MTAPPADVTFDTVLAHSPEVMFQEVGGEAVLLDLASEQYFGLDPVGTRIWSLIDGDAPLGRIHAALCSEFDAEPAAAFAGKPAPTWHDLPGKNH